MLNYYLKSPRLWQEPFLHYIWFSERWGLKTLGFTEKFHRFFLKTKGNCGRWVRILMYYHDEHDHMWYDDSEIVITPFRGRNRWRCTMRPFWTRLEGESQESYEGFAIYRDLGPTRTLSKVGQRLMKSPKALARLSKKNHWVKRANEYDAYMGQRKVEAVAKGYGEQARVYQKLAIKLAEELIQGIEEGTRGFDTPTLTENIIRFYDIFKDVNNILSMAETLQGKRPEQAVNEEDFHPPLNSPGIPTEQQETYGGDEQESLSVHSDDDKSSEGARPDCSKVTHPLTKIRQRLLYRTDPDTSQSQ